MPDLWYIAAVLAIVFTITVMLRAVPFAILRPLRKSRFAKAMAEWMPAGILIILAAATLANTVQVDPAYTYKALLAVAVTLVVHVVGRRRTLLSVGLGTAAFVLMVNLLP